MVISGILTVMIAIPNRNSSATEIWYDGVDQDCSGGSDFDQDSDGEDSDQYGGADCDDTMSLSIRLHQMQMSMVSTMIAMV